MAISFKRPAEPPFSYAIVGKLPSRPDFIRINAGHPVVGEFDELVAQGVELAGRAQDGLSRYDEAQWVDFFYVSRNGRWAFIGVMQPSRDQAGRRYPLIAGVIVPIESLGWQLATLPLLLELFYVGLREQLASAVENSVDLLACRRFLEEQVAVGGFALTDFDLAHRLLERFQRRQPASALAQLVGEQDPSAFERLLANTGFYLELLRRYRNAATQQLMLFPLPDRKGEEALYQGCWLSIYAAYAEPMLPPSLPSYFIAHIGGRACLALAPQRVSEKFLAVLFGAPLDSWSVLDIDDSNPPWSGHHLYAETVYVLGRLLSDLQSPISSLLEPLSDIGIRLGKSA
jgi:type VI secretion system protein ImpM